MASKRSRRSRCLSGLSLRRTRRGSRCPCWSRRGSDDAKNPSWESLLPDEPRPSFSLSARALCIACKRRSRRRARFAARFLLWGAKSTGANNVGTERRRTRCSPLDEKDRRRPAAAVGASFVSPFSKALTIHDVQGAPPPTLYLSGFCELPKGSRAVSQPGASLGVDVNPHVRRGMAGSHLLYLWACGSLG